MKQETEVIIKVNEEVIEALKNWGSALAEISSDVFKAIRKAYPEFLLLSFQNDEKAAARYLKKMRKQVRYNEKMRKRYGHTRN